MNPRIRELLERATTNIGSVPGNSGEGWILDEGKFAELLIEEVCDVLDREQWNKGKDWVCVDESTIIEKIREHFGVQQ